MLRLQRSIGNQAVLRLFKRQPTPTIQREYTYAEDDATIHLPTADLTQDQLRDTIVQDPVIRGRMIFRSDDGAHATETLQRHSNLSAIFQEIRTRRAQGQTLNPLQMHFRFTYEPIDGTEGRRVREIEISLPGLAPLPAPAPTPTPDTGSSEPPAVPPAHPSTSSSDTMSRAVELFAASATSGTERGARVLGRMRALVSQSEIVYGTLPAGTSGHTIDNPGPIENAIGRAGRPDITISSDHNLDIIVTALTMVHEVHHHLVDALYVIEEYRSRELEILFYRELLTGITMGGERYQAVAGTDPTTETGLRWYERDQLVDYLISLYPGEDFLSAQWVRDNYNTSWGGLRNRWQSSKARFLRTLCLENDPSRDIVTVLNILESIADDTTYQNIVRMVGSDDLSRGEQMLRNFIRESGVSGTSPDGPRVPALEARFHTTLH
jgi:hypothetical protein